MASMVIQPQSSSLSSSSLWAMAGISIALTAGYIYRAKYNKAAVLYLLYARTPLGRFMHQSAVAQAHQKAAAAQAKSSLVGFPPQPESKTTKNMAAFTYRMGEKALVRIVPFLSDNYAYIVVCKTTKECAVVDPADAETVHEAFNDLQQELGGGLKLSTILTTHYHHDHAGGNKALVKMLKESNSDQKVEIVGSANESWPGVPGVTRKVKHDDLIQVGKLEIKCLDVPCHTWGSILFLLEKKVCFTGDYLFSAGCGRFFEGGAEDFCASLAKSVNPLGDDVLIFPGHEYTVSNLKFASKVLPEDETIKRRLEMAISTRDAGEPTIPSTLGDERKINVFLRAGDSRLLTASLADRVVEMVKEKGPDLEMASGSDKHDPSKRNVTIEDKNDVVQIVRALRALKDRG